MNKGSRTTTSEAVAVATTTRIQAVSSIRLSQVRKCRHLVTAVVVFMLLVAVQRLICHVLIVVEWVTCVQDAVRLGEW